MSCAQVFGERLHALKAVLRTQGEAGDVDIRGHPLGPGVEIVFIPGHELFRQAEDIAPDLKKIPHRVVVLIAVQPSEAEPRRATFRS